MQSHIWALHLQGRLKVHCSWCHGTRWEEKFREKREKCQTVKASRKPARPSPDGFEREEPVAKYPPRQEMQSVGENTENHQWCRPLGCTVQLGTTWNGILQVIKILHIRAEQELPLPSLPYTSAFQPRQVVENVTTQGAMRLSSR